MLKLLRMFVVWLGHPSRDSNVGDVEDAADDVCPVGMLKMLRIFVVWWGHPHKRENIQ
jgi:hypothetical protein